MKLNQLTDFQVVPFSTDRDSALKELGVSGQLVSAINSDNSTAIFKVVQIAGQLLQLGKVEQSRPLQIGDSFHFIFSLATGQYTFEATLENSPGAGSYAVDISQIELRRLQRRDSFRVEVPTTIPLRFYYNVSALIPSAARRVVDVSTGGMAIRVRSTDPVAQLAIGGAIRGILHLTGRDVMPVEGVVKHIDPPGPDQVRKIGIQLLCGTHEEQRELLSLTLHLHREINRAT